MNTATQSQKRAQDQHHEEPVPESKTTDRVQRKAHSVIDNAASKAAELEKSVRSGADDAQQQLSEKREAAAESLKTGVNNVEDFVQRRPLAAAGIAFAAGILTSRLLRK